MKSGHGDEKARKRVMEIIENDSQDLVDLCLHLASIWTPAGKERPCAEAVVEWFTANGIKSFLQPITEESANAVGVIPGKGGGKSLICDAHIDQDVLPVGDSEVAKQMQAGWVEGDMLYGAPVVNCKGQVAAFMMAARSLNKAGIRLKGDLNIAAVAFETGLTSVDEFQGINYPGEGLGSRWLVDRGVTADYALIGETSQFCIVPAECGYTQFKIRIRGRRVYTPRIERGATWQENPNAFVQASHVALALEEWAIGYEKRNQLEFWGGVIKPKAQIIGMRGGRGAELGAGACDIHLDVWILPGANPRDTKKEIDELLHKLGIKYELTQYQWGRGYIAQNAEPLMDAIKDAHHTILNTEMVNPPSNAISMWRDLNAFNEVGIPSICYGPSRQKETYSEAQDRAMKISDLVAVTKIYALTAISVCGVAEA